MKAFFSTAKQPKSKPEILPDYSVDGLQEDLLAIFTQRVAHLEQQIKELQEYQLNFIRTQTLLQMAETFREFHNELRQFTAARKLSHRDIRKVKFAEIVTKDSAMMKVMEAYGLRREDLLKTRELCLARNSAAHPSNEPDLSEASPDVVRLYVTVRQLLKDLKAAR